jgi:excisionase family DNA binding protein
MKRLLNIKEAAELLNVNVKTVRRLIYCNLHPITYKKIGGAIQFLELDLLAWIHFKKSWAELGVNERKVVFDYEQ